MACRSGSSILASFASLAALLVSGATLAEPPPKQVAAPSPPAASASPSGQAGKDHVRRAMVLHDEAGALYEQGRYRAAIAKLEAALVIDPNGKELVYNLALIHEKLADVDAAAGYYRRYLTMETDAKARERTLLVLRRLEGARAEFAVTPRAAGDAPGASAAAATPMVRPVRPWVIITGTVSASALVIGSILGIAAITKHPGAEARTGGGVTIADLESDARQAHTSAIVADAAFVICALTAGLALTLYLTTPKVPAPRSTSASPAPRLGMTPGAGRGLLEVRF